MDPPLTDDHPSPTPAPRSLDTQIVEETSQTTQPSTPSDELDLEDFTSDAPLIETKGDIDEVWPDNCNNQLPELGEHQTRTIKSRLLEETIIISFNEEPERRRHHSNMLPRKLYRTQYETSTTLSRYVDKHTHPKHRSNIQLKIQSWYAFQSLGMFQMREDLTRERIERHLVWNKKIDPSSLISAFNDLDRAKSRANFHYDDSQRIGHRVLIAQISTNGLIAATVKARMETTVTVTTNNPKKLDISVKSAIKIRDVTIPVWIRDIARPSNQSTITEKQRVASGADMWMSVTELRRSDLKAHTPKIRKWDTICTKGHDYEWLACGFVPTSCIDRVMPWDGVMLHTTQDWRIVRSIGSPDPWIWDWQLQMWRLDPRLYRTACFLAVYGGNKRKGIVADDADEEPPAKRRKKKKIAKPTKAQKARLDDNPYVTAPIPADQEPGVDAACCSQCGQKKAAFRLEDEVAGPLSFLDLAASTKATKSILDWN
ncbi:hypothetical protein FB567DRAFT_82437 [Paraphoma chrysanthemicola]|uniref:Uncharacterized protein n=1 Tax=Paraphoma chrysanthemicola TaxID=798071 RepID=A0A8K0R2Z9_9PLEO|nr:hypothetical protein FB567DRAFT_82437 [Paraphoma chrysanthemicola]